MKYAVPLIIAIFIGIFPQTGLKAQNIDTLHTNPDLQVPKNLNRPQVMLLPNAVKTPGITVLLPPATQNPKGPHVMFLPNATGIKVLLVNPAKPDITIPGIRLIYPLNPGDTTNTRVQIIGPQNHKINPQGSKKQKKKD